MSIVSKEDLLQKQAEAKNTLETFTCRVLSVQVQDVSPPARRRFTTRWRNCVRISTG